ncbi:MAG: flagellar basal body-associated FliL family protein [Planctomycetota bacterium]|jgi:flagellar basal body-associated protein FliL
MPAIADRQPEALREERQGPFTAAGFVIMLVAIGAAVATTRVLVKPSPIAVVTEARGGKGESAGSAAELLAPTVVMPEPVIVSVPVSEGGTDFRAAVLQVAIKIGKIEGRDNLEADLDYLQKVYVPRVRALLPEVRHKLISMAGIKSVQQLRGKQKQHTILNSLKADMNKILQSHGVERRIRQVYWHSFHFD